MKKFDVAVIGAGPGGYEAALKAAQLGAKTCCIEKYEVGGVCLNWGCIPTKSLLASSKIYKYFSRAAEFGIKVEGSFSPDMEAIMARKDKIVQTNRKGIEGLFKGWGVELIKGRAVFESRKTLSVDGYDESVNADKIIIATGSKPMEFSQFPFSVPGIMSSDGALSLREIPGKLLIVGAGVIGCEFATLFRELGSEIIMVELMERALPTMDESLSAILTREFKKMKIKLITGTSLEKVSESGNGLNCQLGCGETYDVDRVLVSIGRDFMTEGLGLEKAGVKTGRRGVIEVNEYLETNIEGIYAIGDAVGGMMLAHKASAEGKAAAANAMGKKISIDSHKIPGAVFTYPEIASVGFTEEEVKKKGIDYRTGTFDFRGLGKAHAIGELSGMVKILSDSTTDEILGVHIIGPQASVIIHEAAVAMRNGLTAKDIAKSVHAHPTMSEALMEAAHDVYGECLYKPGK